MSIFDKISERVGDFVDEVLLPEPVRRAHDTAAEMVANHRYQRALEVLNATLVRFPDVARTHHLIGVCHFHRESWGEAIAAFERALSIKEIAATHYYAGQAAEQLQQWHDVQRHFSRALSLGEELSFAYELHFGLGRAYRELNRVDKAIRELRNAAAVTTTSEVLVALAQTLLDADLVDDAAVSIDGADRSRPDVLFVLAQVQERRGDLRGALTTYARAAAEPSEVRAACVVGAARVALALELPSEAQHHLDSLGRAEGFAGDIHTLRGRIAELAGSFATAGAVYQAALEEAPGNVVALLGVGRTALAQGDVDAAAAAFVRTFDAPDAAQRQEGLWGAGRCHLAAGDLAGARHLFEQAQQLPGARSCDAVWSLGEVALQLGDAAEAIVFLQEALDLATDAQRAGVQATLDEALARLAPRWVLPEQLEGPEQLNTVLTALLEYLGRDSRLAEFLPATQRLFTTMNSPLSLAIVGEFNAGKSTIVNALVGEDVFPTGVLPTTAHTGILRWGPRKAARVLYTDGAPVEQSLEQAKRTMKDNAERIERVEFTHPHPDLRLVHYWDTPGFNALDERHEAVALQALSEAEAILWVMDANQVLSQTEFDRIEDLPDGQERLLVVINKIDRLGPAPKRQSQLDELMAYVEDNLDGYIAGAFGISAQDATSDDAAVAETSGFAAFRDFLESHVVHRAGRIKTVEVRRQLTAVAVTLQAYQNGLIQRYGALAREIGEVEVWLDQLGHQMPQAQAREEVALIEEWMSRTLDALEDEIDDALRPANNWTGRRSLGDEDRAFVLDLGIRQLDRILDASKQRMRGALGQIERELAERLDPVVRSLSLSDARALQRRLDGFFDESRVIAMLWDERVYGATTERARGRRETSGDDVLDAVVAAQSDRAVWRGALRRLLPPIDDEFGDRIERWYAAFFDAARRLCDRIRRDLELLELEAQTRYDVQPVVDLLAAHEYEPSEEGPGELSPNRETS